MNRILLVEDHEAMRELVVRELQQAGIAADAVGRVGEAEACLAQVRYAALVLDRGLPDGDLVARVRALLRRQSAWVASSPQWAGLVVDPAGARLSHGRSSVNLAPSELQLMLALVRAEGRVVRRGALEAAAWGLTEPVTPNALDVAVHRLRRKLDVLGSTVRLATTKGVGYALEQAPGAAGEHGDPAG